MATIQELPNDFFVVSLERTYCYGDMEIPLGGVIGCFRTRAEAEALVEAVQLFQDAHAT